MDLAHVRPGAVTFRDGLGDRLAGFDRESGRPLELLRPRPEVAALETRVAERLDALAGFADRRFTRLLGLAHDPLTGRVHVVSERVHGMRLSEVLERAGACHLVPDLTVALYAATQTLQALGALDRACGTAHGLVGLDRTIVTPRGRLVISDYLFAPVVERLAFSHAFLWRELHVAMPRESDRLDSRVDVAQVAVMVVEIALGRRLAADEYPDRWPGLVAEVREIAGIRGGSALADALADWLDLALPTANAGGLADAPEAYAELIRTLPQDPRVAPSRRDLRELLDQIAEAEAAEPPAAAPDSVPLAETPLSADAVAEPTIVEPTPVELCASAGAGLEDTLDAEAVATEDVGVEEPPEDLEPVEEIPDLEVPAGRAAEGHPEETFFAAALQAAGDIPGVDRPSGTADATALARAAYGAPGGLVTGPPVGSLDAAEPLVEPLEWAAARDAAAEPAAVTEERSEPAKSAPPFDFVIPLPPPPLAAPGSAGARDEREVVETSPPAAAEAPSASTSPRSPLIDDFDPSKLPDWMLAPESPSDRPPPAPSPLQPPVALVIDRPTWVAVPEPPPEPVAHRRTEPPPVVAPPLVQPPAEEPVVERVERTKRFVQDLLARRGERPAAPGVLGLERSVEPAPEPPEMSRPERRSGRRLRAALATAAVLVALAIGVATGVRWVAGRARPGTLVVESTPPGSEVWVDGDRRGLTPLTLTVSPGRHTLELRWRGRTRTFPLDVAPAAALTQTLDWGRLADTGTLKVTSDPTGAQVLVDGRPRGETPVEIGDLSVGRHTVVVRSDAGSVTERVTIRADEPATLDVLIYPGWLAVFAPVDVEIFERGQRLGSSSDGRIVVPPGRHEVQIVNEDYGYRATHALEVRPGAVASLSVEPKALVNISATPWAYVFLDDQFLGETPLVNVSVTIGTREFVFRHPEHGERRVVAVVTLKNPVQIMVDMTKR